VGFNYAMPFDNTTTGLVLSSKSGKPPGAEGFPVRGGNEKDNMELFYCKG